MKEKIQFKLNGKQVGLEIEGDQTLLWVIRTELGLTGTKYGCGEGYCGSCTILVDGATERSCSLMVSDVNGKNVTTIEGLAKDGKLHPVQQAFVEKDSLQCGFCTPGMILTAVALLNDNPKPTEDEIIQGMEDNLCRCGSHLRIVEAIQTASKNRGGN